MPIPINFYMTFSIQIDPYTIISIHITPYIIVSTQIDPSIIQSWFDADPYQSLYNDLGLDRSV